MKDIEKKEVVKENKQKGKERKRVWLDNSTIENDPNNFHFGKVKINPISFLSQDITYCYRRAYFFFQLQCVLMLLSFTTLILQLNGLTIALSALVQIAWCPWCYSWITARLMMSLPFVSIPASDTRISCLGCWNGLFSHHKD